MVIRFIFDQAGGEQRIKLKIIIINIIKPVKITIVTRSKAWEGGLRRDGEEKKDLRERKKERGEREDRERGGEGGEREGRVRR